jgi:hypothetical protein
MKKISCFLCLDSYKNMFSLFLSFMSRAIRKIAIVLKYYHFIGNNGSELEHIID